VGQAIAANDGVGHLSPPIIGNSRTHKSSGSGKSTIARNLYASQGEPVKWDSGKAVIDCFGDVPVKDIVRMLTIVGFSSPPSWIKPYDGRRSIF